MNAFYYILGFVGGLGMGGVLTLNELYRGLVIPFIVMSSFGFIGFLIRSFKKGSYKLATVLVIFGVFISLYSGFYFMKPVYLWLINLF